LSVGIVPSNTAITYIGSDIHNFLMKKVCTCGNKCHYICPFYCLLADFNNLWTGSSDEMDSDPADQVKRKKLLGTQSNNGLLIRDSVP
jgi:hypothetical protein